MVAGNSGKKCLAMVINLRYVNQFLLKQKFKYEDLRTAFKFMLFNRGDFICTFAIDLKSGYHHVDIHRELQQFLGFA